MTVCIHFGYILQLCNKSNKNSHVAFVHMKNSI